MQTVTIGATPFRSSAIPGGGRGAARPPCAIRRVLFAPDQSSHRSGRAPAPICLPLPCDHVRTVSWFREERIGVLVRRAVTLEVAIVEDHPEQRNAGRARLRRVREFLPPGRCSRDSFREGIVLALAVLQIPL